MLWLDAESVGTEVVALCLQHVGRQVFCAVAVVEAESGGESRCWDTPESTLADDVSPSWLCLVDGLVEEVVEEQVLEIRVVTVCRGDILQEDGTDDAASTPHQGNRGLVELPAVLLGSLFSY